MGTYLRHGVYMCLVDEGAIFLDIRANAYLGIDAVTKEALTRHLVGLDAVNSGHSLPLKGELPHTLAELTRRGLLTDSPSTGRPFSSLSLSMAHCVPFGTGRSESNRMRVIDLVRFMTALSYASIMMRRGHLFSLINRLVILKSSVATMPRTADWQKIRSLVHTFRRLSTLFYTSKNACLLDSLVLTEFLIRHGYQPTLVLGVHTKPFFAHAWVQIENCVLNDSLEHAQTLTPIAAL
jgi:hypothetical protein